MDSEEPKSSKDQSARLGALLRRRSELQEELRDIEERVYNMETTYLLDSSESGNVLKGFERFLSTSKNIISKKSRKVKLEDRLFSLSSVTSPAAKELGVGRDDGRSNSGPSGSKSPEKYAKRHGRLKRGRPASSEAKRSRHTSEQISDYGDDPDLTS